MSARGVEQIAEQSVGQKSSLDELLRIVQRLHRGNRIALGILWVVALFVALVFAAIIVLLLVQGFTALIDPSFYAASDLGIGRQLFNTFYVLILTEIILFPLALAAAIYMVEYAPQGPFVTTIRFAAETLAGVPSIVLGLFGVVLFGSIFGFHISRLTGALALLCLNMPLSLRLFEDALLAVPRELREGSLALGSTKWRMIRTVVLPSALPGLITGLILSAGKIVGETAALVFTMGVSNPANVFTLDPLLSSDTLTIHLWYVKTQGAGSIPGLTTSLATEVSAGSAALLIIILFVINILARGLGRAIQRRIMAA
ncbi:phosphate transport system permease protein PstA [Reticulibacter mediterranei]|uniref:Phosphate transport system permease protein PstA n=1 Tax=Reticulibacter mediterranei TaxID=2778369 RepID=A0A8J3N2S6_9CHLR|nr:phosphate ABC transporter permease PstA [Reticulibacter mediterranei]GHO93505.1 phosphate transport system permease protein PstA [Reticulibacter mediterranei]